MEPLLIAILSLLPGAWVGFGLRLASLSLVDRIALSVAFSPVVASLELLILAFLGVPAQLLAPVILVLNLPSAGLACARWRSLPRPARPESWGWKLLLAALPVGWLAIQWSFEPNYRVYGWHNLMHVDIAHQVSRLPALPEEPELAGLPLAYPWLAHGYWTVLGLLSDRPPTQVFPLANLVLLLATLALLYRAARALGAHEAWAMLAAVLALLAAGPNALVGKFLYLDLSPGSFALFAALVLFCVAVPRSPIRGATGATALALLGLALTHAMALPAAVALIGSAAFFRVILAGEDFAFWRRDAAHLLAACLLVSGLALAWVFATAAGGSRPLVRFGSLFEFRAKGEEILLRQGPLLLLALPAIAKGVRERKAALLALSVTGLGLLAVYAVLALRGAEYKYMLYSRIALAPLVGLGVHMLLGRWRRSRWLVAASVAGVMTAASLIRAAPQLVPRTLKDASAVDESSFELSLAESLPDAGWTQAVRTGTPPETILVAQGLSFHASAFVARSLYFPCETDGRHAAGYNQPNWFNLLLVRGYPKAVWSERREVVETLYTSREPERIGSALGELRKLGRPLAIHFASKDAAGLAWLRESGLGRPLFADAHAVVWFVGARGAAGGDD